MMESIGSDDRAGYSPLAKALHWLVAAAVLSNIPMGIVMVNLNSGPVQDRLFNLHRSVGALVLALAILRLAVRLVRGAPPPLPTLARWQRIVSDITHKALYLLIFVVPLIGWAATSAYGAEIVVFGLFVLPPILPHNEPLSETLFLLHRAAAILTAALAAMHIGAALMHGFILRDGVLSRMLPRRWA